MFHGIWFFSGLDILFQYTVFKKELATLPVATLTLETAGFFVIAKNKKTQVLETETIWMSVWSLRCMANDASPN